jgi:hypothetical protein
MKILGICLLVAGLLVGIYSAAMDVSVATPRQSLGDGTAIPAMQVANIDLMAQRQNLMIFGGILAVVGTLLIGFSSIASGRKAEVKPATARRPRVADAATPSGPTSVSICPKCRFMGDGAATLCARCESPLSS